MPSLFQKRHCEWLADVLRTSQSADLAAHSILLDEIADALARDNPRFNREKFRAAAGAYRESVAALKRAVGRL